jgi:HD superfamily phosphohydrolase YqeK
MFKDYLKEYDMEDNKIDLKYHHSFRVADISSRIAISLNLAKEEIDIAKLTGLLHDIGRFEQETEFHSFKDAKTKDHGYRGSFILFNKGYIKKYIKEDKYDDLIEKAIYSHNKLNIPDEYNEREVLFSKIIRDADKIDILYINSNIDIKSDVGDDDITSEVIESLKKHELIDIQYIHTKLDDILLMVDFVYDIYFKYSIIQLKEINMLI